MHPKRKAGRRQPFIGRIALIILALLAPADCRASDAPSTRTIHFPTDRSAGEILIRDWGTTSTHSSGQSLGKARGSVRIPAGMEVLLQRVRSAGDPPLAPLSCLGPNEVQRIESVLADRETLAILAGLTGLRQLDLNTSRLDAQTSLDPLGNLTQLESLSLRGGRIPAGGLEPLTRLASLRHLSIEYFRFASDGLAVLDALPALETLSLAGPDAPALSRMRVPVTLRGLHLRDALLNEPYPWLSALSSLQSLVLERCNVDGAWAADIRLPALRTLTLKGGSLSESLCRAIGHWNALETVSISTWAKTNGVLAPLGNLPRLRRLTISAPDIEDAELAAFGRLQSLEELRIRDAKIACARLKHLGPLRSLRTLHLAVVNLDEAAGAVLEDLPSLQDLSLSIHGTAGARLAGLEALSSIPEVLLSMQNVTDEQLAAVAGLRSLQALYLKDGCITQAGLTGLADLPSLRGIQFYGIELLGDNLCLEGLPALRWCRIARSRLQGSLHIRGLPLLEMVYPWLKRIDGDGVYLEDLPSITRLDLRHAEIADGQLHIRDLPALRLVAAAYQPIGNRTLSELAKAPSLEELDLSHTRVTDEGLPHLEDLRHLRTLDLPVTSISDAGLKHIGKLTSLEKLSLGATRISDAGLAHLENLNRLRELDISWTPVTDAGLARLQNLPALETVNVCETQVGDAALAGLAQRPSLRKVKASAGQFSDSALAALNGRPPVQVARSSRPGRSRPSRRPRRPKVEIPFSTPSDWPNLYVAFRRLQRLGDTRVETKGIVRPGDLPPGHGIHVVVDPDPATTRPVPLDRLHVWIMDPGYEPVKWRKSDDATSPVLWAAYAGRSGSCRVFYRPDPLDLSKEPSTSLEWGIQEAFLINNEQSLSRPPSFFERLCGDFEGPDPEARRRAIDEFYLLAARSCMNRYYWTQYLTEHMEEAFRQAAASGDKALRDYIRHLYTKGDILAALPSMEHRRNGRSTPSCCHIVLMKAVEDRPDLTEAVYRHLLVSREVVGRHEPVWRHFLWWHFLPMLAPPPAETLRAVLRAEPPEEGFVRGHLNDLQCAAVRHVVRADYPGFALELAPHIAPNWHAGPDKETAQLALEYMRRHRADRAFAPGLLRAFHKYRGLDPFWAYRLIQYDPKGCSESGSWSYSYRPPGAGGLWQWIESGWPWRGNLDAFCTPPRSDELKQALLKYLERQDSPGLWRHSNSEIGRVVAFNLCVRHPERQALGALFRGLALGPDFPFDDRPNWTSDSIYRELVFNRHNLPCLYAAQAIIRLGPEVSRTVLDRAIEQFDRKGDKQPGSSGDHQYPRPSDVELCILIVGFLGDPGVYDDFLRFGEQLSSTRIEKTWQIADKWFRQGGKTFHLPRPPLECAASPVAAKPLSRTQSLTGSVGALFFRDRHASGTASWKYPPKKTVPKAAQVKLRIGRGSPTVLQQWLAKNGPRIGLQYQIPYAAIPPDLWPLRSLGPTDVQALDLSGLVVDDYELAHLRHLTGLFELNLHDTDVQGKGLRHLKAMTSLDVLDLSRTPLTDSGVVRLKPLKSLRILDLGNTPITDAAVEHLGQLTRLRVLVINDTKIGREGFDALRQALPQCEIWR